MNKLQKNLSLLLVLFIAFSFRIFLFNFIPLSKLFSQNFFLLELINVHFSLSVFLTILLGLINLILIFLIGKKIANYKVGVYSALVYAISPWVVYLEVGSSIYILLLTCLLIFFYSSLNLESKNKYFQIGIFVSSALLLFSSLFMLVVMPILSFCLYKLGIIKGKFLKYSITFLICLSALVSVILLSNISGFKNIYTQQITIFSNVGLVNAVNSFRGEVGQTNFALIGKFIENRYFYLAEHVIFNFLNHLVPVTYFTQEFKMFNFSFSPPILFGFLLFLFFGLKNYLQNFKKHIWIIVGATCLFIPSILSKNSPDINRLVLASPVFFLLIGIGMDNLINQKKKLYKIIFLISLFIIFIQAFTTVSDIALHEKIRMERL